MTSRGEALGTAKRSPTCNDRQFLRHGCPPRRKPFVFGEKKTHVGEGSRFFARRDPVPEAVTKSEHDSDHFAHPKLAEGLQFLCGESGLEAHGAVFFRTSLQNRERK